MKWKREPKQDDPRLTEHETEYSASRGGWYPRTKPTTGKPDTDEKGRRRWL